MCLCCWVDAVTGGASKPDDLWYYSIKYDDGEEEHKVGPSGGGRSGNGDGGGDAGGGDGGNGVGGGDGGGDSSVHGLGEHWLHSTVVQLLRSPHSLWMHNAHTPSYRQQ